MREEVTEIIRKECERYRLLELGLLTSVDEVADILLTTLPKVDERMYSDPERYKIWSREVVGRLYLQLNYTDFLKQQGKGPAFRRFLFFLRKRLLDRLQRLNNKPTIDVDLAMPAHTLAFKLSVMLSEEADEALFKELFEVSTAREIEEKCSSFCEEYFPVNMDVLLERLMKKDDGFWNELYLLIENIATRVTSYLRVSILYSSDVERDTWSDTSLLIYNKIVSGMVPVFESAAHFRNYMTRVCVNKCHEAVRRNRKQEVSIDNPDLALDALLMQMATDEEQMLGNNTDGVLLADVDQENMYEMGCALTSILWNRTEPWYSRLTEGIEDKVAVLLQHYAEGLSYEQIAVMRAPCATSAELQRLQNKLRQDVVRVRKVLKKQFQKILSKQ